MGGGGGGEKKFPDYVQLIMWNSRTDQEEAIWFKKSDFCVSVASYVASLLTMEIVLLQNLAE